MIRNSHTYSFSVSAQRVGEVLCSETFNVAFDEERADAKSSRFEVKEQRDDRLVFVVHTEEYKRSKMGKIDRSGTIMSHTAHTWDGRAGTLTWIYKGDARADVRGVYRVIGRGDDRCQVVHDYTIEVKVPLIGNQIAKLIDKEFREVIPRFERTLSRFLAQ